MLSLEKVLPQIQHQDSLAQGDVFSQPLVGDLRITFAVDQAPLTAVQVQELGQDAVELLQRSLDNLDGQLTSMSGQPISGSKFGLETDRPVFTSLKVGQGLESCLLLLPHVWQQLAAGLSGELLVGVPGRDLVMYTSSDHFEGQLAMRKVLDAAYEHAGVKALSRELLVWRDAAWHVYTELQDP